MVSRRAFVSAGFLMIAGAPGKLWAGTRRRAGGTHPEPRPGITAANVLTGDQLANAPHAIDVFDLVREIPQIIDGIRCQCGCAELPGFYSLLSCYESAGMARWCDICQGEGRLASRLHKTGKTLDEIRAAIDARFG
ncbi:MAG: PCYCGC domain-containing protein [Gemmatimonadota bacterium]|nr:PCYCGC domain-containing protein [Gemmatimonadota bacterium]MDH4347878.1 PCYCGC domain-containing protein [Gemmatimonadota bacterium]MDH5284545.1 PCYCGC domain-containing protein [Gemmatimonadota bacterium]